MINRIKVASNDRSPGNTTNHRTFDLFPLGLPIRFCNFFLRPGRVLYGYGRRFRGRIEGEIGLQAVLLNSLPP